MENDDSDFGELLSQFALTPEELAQFEPNIHCIDCLFLKDKKKQTQMKKICCFWKEIFQHEVMKANEETCNGFRPKFWTNIMEADLHQQRKRRGK